MQKTDLASSILSIEGYDGLRVLGTEQKCPDGSLDNGVMKFPMLLSFQGAEGLRKFAISYLS